VTSLHDNPVLNISSQNVVKYEPTDPKGMVGEMKEEKMVDVHWTQQGADA
jgi:hypothetical protein